ncbi:MAG: hypothetical protein H8E79_02860 [Desulfobulbaceae bacterium]|uniref:Uncharacterized protein n=1 Tax=Candidatus Desulfatifera sulfidica TaxID=2841691 RepID=A0A8J6N7F5_9BACT|nr:hypothetical protein [Candidatus Desulfatifera sulfidica]
MYLFDTESGDQWVCITCARVEAEEIKEKGWEMVMEKDEPMLRCSLCKGPDYEMEG